MFTDQDNPAQKTLQIKADICNEQKEFIQKLIISI